MSSQGYSIERITSLGKMVYDLAQSGDLRTIRQTYIELAQELHQVPDVSSAKIKALNRDEIKDVLRALGRSGKPHHLSLASAILADLPKLFGLQRGVNFHTVIVRALVEHDNLVSARSWLETIRNKPGELLPTYFQWHLVLDHYAAKEDIPSLLQCISEMPRSGIRPSFQSFDILWSAMTSVRASVWQFRCAIKAISDAGLPHSKRTESMIFEHFARVRGDKKAGVDLVRSYRMPFERDRALDPSFLSKEECLAELARTSRLEGIRAAAKKFLALKIYKPIPKSSAMATLLKDSTRPEALHRAARYLRFAAGIQEWSILINNAIVNGHVSTALAIYSEARKSGIQPDSAMVHPIIGALCQTAFKQPCEKDIDLALDLYKHLSRPESPSIHGSPNNRARPDAGIFNALLRALSAAPNVDKYYPVALSLVQDMNTLGVTIDRPMMTASLMSITMRKSNSYAEAFREYERFCKNADAVTLDEKGFIFVLNVFSKLSSDTRPLIPPPALYFHIVKDMRSAGFSCAGQSYSILWRRLAYLAVQEPQDNTFRKDLIACIRESHKHLTLDASFTPTPIIWNQLMDTYQRAGCFIEAHRIWDHMEMSGMISDASVTIILDACGHHGVGDVADAIWSKLRAGAFPLTPKNWLTWLECLCRLNRLHDALETLFTEVGKFQYVGAAAEQILLTFAERENRQDEVRSLITHRISHLSKTLRQDQRDKGPIQCIAQTR